VGAAVRWWTGLYQFAIVIFTLLSIYSLLLPLDANAPGFQGRSGAPGLRAGRACLPHPFPELLFKEFCDAIRTKGPGQRGPYDGLVRP